MCTSVNECVCHGIPDSRKLVEGDIINIDVTVYLDVSTSCCSRYAHMACQSNLLHVMMQLPSSFNTLVRADNMNVQGATQFLECLS